MIGYLLQLALRQLRRYGAQSTLAIIGVAVGAANIIILISIADLARHQATGILGQLGANLLIIAPYVDLKSGPLAGMTAAQAGAHLPDEAREAVASADEIEALAAVLIMPAHVTAGEVTHTTAALGVSVEFLELRARQLSEGRWLNAEDTANRATVICLGNTVRAELFGGAPCLGEEVLLRGERFTVIGVLEREGRVSFEDTNDRVFIPLTTAQALLEFDGVHVMFARYRSDVTEDEAIAAVGGRLKRLLKPGETLEETFSILTLHEAVELMQSTLGIFRSVLAGIASVALLVAGIGTMNVMLIRVLKRRREIGIRRAVGATASAILLQFLLESVAQALLGALLGLLLGVLGVVAYCAWADWQPYISPGTLALATAFSAALGVIFGAYPAFRAARLDPVVSLRCD